LQTHEVAGFKRAAAENCSGNLFHRQRLKYRGTGTFSATCCFDSVDRLRTMKILLTYLKNYKGLIALALFLAAISQVFSLLDPHITGKIVDNFIERKESLSRADFIKGILYLVGLAIGAAMVSRIAKNLQDYFTSIVVQKLGAKMYADGLKHSLELPYQTFEDQRSGETLGILQKVRTDSEKFITSFISVLFASLVGACVRYHLFIIGKL
jgi:ATP-binding cassette subfamily B protein